MQNIAPRGAIITIVRVSIITGFVCLHLAVPTNASNSQTICSAVVSFLTVSIVACFHTLPDEAITTSCREAGTAQSIRATIPIVAIPFIARLDI
jgi:hypothetical protein